MATRTRTAVWTLAGLVWLTATVGGLAWMADFANRPGSPAHAPNTWPSNSALAPDRAGPTLVVLAHPRCDCTRATLTELAELMARTPRRPRAFVVFIKPAEADDEWEQTDVWQDASRIPGVTVFRDVDSQETQGFGAETSGQALLYDRNGRLLFSGGLTGSRGHAGDNAGFETLLALLGNQPSPQAPTSAVFGCALLASPERTEASTRLGS